MKLCPQVTLPHCEMDGAFPQKVAIPSSAAAASSLSNRDSGRLGECEDDFGEGEEEEEEEEEEAGQQGGNHGGGRGRLQQGGGGAAGGNARRRNKVRKRREGRLDGLMRHTKSMVHTLRELALRCLRDQVGENHAT